MIKQKNSKWKETGKGVATIGVWGAVAVTARYSPDNVFIVALLGLVATWSIWGTE